MYRALYFCQAELVGEKSIQENLNRQLFAKKIPLSAHSVLSPSLLLVQGTFSRISCFSGSDGSMVVKPTVKEKEDICH